MKIFGRYSHYGGEEFIQKNHPALLEEVERVVSLIDAEKCRLKAPKDKEKKRAARAGVTLFYSPKHLNALFDYYLFTLHWDLKPRINTEDVSRKGYREIDFLKDGVSIEVQFGKYSFLTYDIVAKLPIFKKLGLVECGIEICAMASMLPHLSSGIGAFEQVRWDLMQRGVSNLDLPVLVLGVDHDKSAERLKLDRELAGQLSLGTQSEDDEDDSNDTSIRHETLKESTPIYKTNRAQWLPLGTIIKVRETGLEVNQNVIEPKSKPKSKRQSKKNPGPQLPFS